MELLILRIKTALNKFAVEQDVIIRQDAHEEALTGLLLGYFRNEFSDLDFDIDTQYNKRILENELVNKQAEFLIANLPLKEWPLNWENGQKNIRKEILPDFIFHNRESANHNFLIVELKKSTNKDLADRAWDHLKLKEMTRRELNYDYGLFVDLNTGSDYEMGNFYHLTFYADGEIVYQE